MNKCINKLLSLATVLSVSSCAMPQNVPEIIKPANDSAGAALVSKRLNLVLYKDQEKN